MSSQNCCLLNNFCLWEQESFCKPSVKLRPVDNPSKSVQSDTPTEFKMTKIQFFTKIPITCVLIAADCLYHVVDVHWATAMCFTDYLSWQAVDDFIKIIKKKKKKEGGWWKSKLYCGWMEQDNIVTWSPHSTNECFSGILGQNDGVLKASTTHGKLPHEWLYIVG